MMMKRLLLPLLILSSLLMSCNHQADEYRIHGTVCNDSLEGVRIFLVPLHDESAAVVDSIEIHDRRFEFKGHNHWMAAVRIHRAYCLSYQDLLVVTEPGDINVVIDTISYGGGTPQNDSLQMWKERTMEYNRASYWLYRAGHEATANNDTLYANFYHHQLDSVRQDYADYTHRLAANLGEGILHDFLLKLYPLSEE